MNNLKTGSTRKFRSDGLQETPLPVPYDATAMPGAFVLGIDGEIYASLKVDNVYQWRRVIGGLGSGEIFIGLPRPRTNFVTNIKTPALSQLIPGVQIEGTTDGLSALAITRSENTVAAISRIVLGKTRGAVALSNDAVLLNDSIATILFSGSDGEELIPGAAISTFVDKTPALGDVPMALFFRTRAQGSGPVGITARMRVTSDGNVLIGNTTGVERLSVTGNIQVTDTANGFRVGANQVLGARRTGWTAATGTATRTAFATSTVTTAELAERVKALIDDLIAHGALGA